MCLKCIRYIEKKYGKSFSCSNWGLKTDLIAQPGSVCICGKDDLSKVYPLYNHKTGDIELLGNICISSIFSANDKLMYQVKHWKCEVCKKVIQRKGSEKHKKSKRHLDKYNLLTLQGFKFKENVLGLIDITPRRCYKCKTDISSTPSYYKYCFTCFKENSKTNVKSSTTKCLACNKIINAKYIKCYNCNKYKLTKDDF